MKLKREISISVKAKQVWTNHGKHCLKKEIQARRWINSLQSRSSLSFVNISTHPWLMFKMRSLVRIIRCHTNATIHKSTFHPLRCGEQPSLCIVAKIRVGATLDLLQELPRSAQGWWLCSCIDIVLPYLVCCEFAYKPQMLVYQTICFQESLCRTVLQYTHRPCIAILL